MHVQLPVMNLVFRSQVKLHAMKGSYIAQQNKKLKRIENKKMFSTYRYEIVPTNAIQVEFLRVDDH
jgi:hypothetical protein